MAEILIGTPAIGRPDASPSGYTFALREGAADGTGTITEAQIYVDTEIGGLEIATFIDEGSDVLSTRDNEAIVGTYVPGYHELVVELDVVTDDYFGLYFASGTIDRTSSGDGYWYKQFDQIPADSAQFAVSGDQTASLYGIGATVNGNGNSLAYKSAGMAAKMIAGKLI